MNSRRNQISRFFFSQSNHFSRERRFPIAISASSKKRRISSRSGKHNEKNIHRTRAISLDKLKIFRSPPGGPERGSFFQPAVVVLFLVEAKRNAFCGREEMARPESVLLFRSGFSSSMRGKNFLWLRTDFSPIRFRFRLLTSHHTRLLQNKQKVEQKSFKVELKLPSR